MSTAQETRPPAGLDEDRDAVLVRRFRRGDEEAFTHLVLRDQHKIYNLIYRLLGSREETEDVAQEVFATVHRCLGSFRGESRFSTWLYRIALNRSRNHLKYLKRRGLNRTQSTDDTREGDIVSAHSSSPSDPEKIVAGYQLEAIIQREISELDPDHREVILLRDIQGLSYEEIGTVTELAPGTVKSRLHRARTTLRARLEKFLR